MDDELVSLLIEGGGRLKTSDIGAVTELSLSVGAENLVTKKLWHPVLVLFLVSHYVDDGGEETVVEAREELLALGVLDASPVRVLKDWFVKDQLMVVLLNKSDFTPHVGLLLADGHFTEGEVVPELFGVLVHNLNHALVLGVEFGIAPKHSSELLLVESAFLALAKQIGSHDLFIDTAGLNRSSLILFRRHQ